MFCNSLETGTSGYVLNLNISSRVLQTVPENTDLEQAFHKPFKIKVNKMRNDKKEKNYFTKLLYRPSHREKIHRKAYTRISTTIRFRILRKGRLECT